VNAARLASAQANLRKLNQIRLDVETALLNVTSSGNGSILEGRTIESFRIEREV
jgi:hypothetical protein